MSKVRKPQRWNFEEKKRVPANNVVKVMPQELAEYRKLYAAMDDMDRDEMDAAREAFNEQYGDYRFEFWGHIVTAERTLNNRAVNLPSLDSSKGYISTNSQSHVGKYSPFESSVDDLIIDMYPRVRFDKDEEFVDGNYIIRKGIDTKDKNNLIWFIIDTKNNAFTTGFDDRNFVQLVPHDMYVGPFETKKSAGFRHEDGTVEHLKANPDKDIQEYLERVGECHGINTYALRDAEFIARYIATPEELSCVNDTLKYIEEVRQEEPHLEMCDFLRSFQFNEADYMGIAKLMPFSDHYDDMKLLNALVLYNDDYSERITDKETIERVQDAFGNTRECYYGENSMTKTLEAQLTMALNAEDAKKQREDAMDIIDGTPDESVADELNVG